MQLSVEYHKYKDKVQHVWLNYSFWNEQSIYNKHFNDLQGETICCLEKTWKNSHDFSPIEMIWVYIINNILQNI